MTITPPMGEWGYTISSIGTTIPVISGFTPSTVRRGSGRTGEKGTIVHLERRTTRSEAAYQEVLTAIRAMIDYLMPDPDVPGYFDAVFPDWSGRVCIMSVTPSYGRNHILPTARLTIQYERVKS